MTENEGSWIFIPLEVISIAMYATFVAFSIWFATETRRDTTGTRWDRHRG